MAVLLAGSLDTKGVEYEFLAAELRGRGVETLVADVGVHGEPQVSADISRDEVAAAAGVRLSELRSAEARSDALEAMAAGLRAIVARRAAGITGAIGMGGSGAVTLLAPAWRALPFGIPKILLTTMVSTATDAVEGSDVLVMPSPVDISGLNAFSRSLLRRAAAVVSAGLAVPVPEGSDRPMVAATMFGVTTTGVVAAARAVEAAGYEVITFHANGKGGRTLEALVRQGHFAGVLDLTTTELADELLGGKASAGPDRLTAAASTGVPQVVSVGALDIANFGPPDSVPSALAGRRQYRHGPLDTLVRTSADDGRVLGKLLAEKLAMATGHVTVMLPTGGTSAIAEDGGAFWDPGADDALLSELTAGLPDHVRVVTVDAPLNTEAFGAAAAGELLELLRS